MKKQRTIDRYVDDILAIYHKITQGEIEGEEEARKEIKKVFKDWNTYKLLVSFNPATTILPVDVAFPKAKEEK